jgi:hypothetical protein
MSRAEGFGVLIIRNVSSMSLVEVAFAHLSDSGAEPILHQISPKSLFPGRKLVRD